MTAPAPVASGIRTVPFLRAGDVVVVDGRPVVVCSLGDPYRDGDGVYRYELRGTADGPRTVTTPVRMGDELPVLTYP